MHKTTFLYIYIYKLKIIYYSTTRWRGLAVQAADRAATHQSWLTGPESCQPYLCASLTAVPSRAAWCMSFFGMQPTLTQVPPRPHLVPARRVKDKPLSRPIHRCAPPGAHCRRQRMNYLEAMAPHNPGRPPFVQAAPLWIRTTRPYP